jgi:16S rRNA (cytidine1402-2'-O)-methyltransferase
MSKLYLVPTPIGNLKDITYRAIEVLREVDLILAEDTRTSGKLLKHYDIKVPIKSHHMHNEHATLSSIIRQLNQGIRIALISDAGTPSISDPGFLLVREAIAAGIAIECLPGATALIPALVLSGLPNDRFLFEGFLPPKKGRKTRLDEISRELRTVIFYESPHKLTKTLDQLIEVCGKDRQISISRELTKLHEETFRGTLDQAKIHFEQKTPKGEFVLCLAGQNNS